MTAALALALVLSAADAPQAEAAEPQDPPRRETVVTGTRSARPLRDAPTTVVVLPREEIDRSPSLTTDQLVRSAPSAATFRRNTSLVADPTSQGLNLRGVGPSGVSRALVLLDGVPATEPFGNWIFWRSVGRLGLERVEIAPGAQSALYGSSAIGGVVQLLSRELRESTAEGDLSGGSFRTAELALRATHRLDRIAFGVEGELLRTDGFLVVGEDVAGDIDRPAGGSHGAVAGRFEARPWDGGQLDLRLSYFEQDQNGGTRFTTSAAALYGGSARIRQELRGGRLDVTAFARGGEFKQTRGRASDDRSTEDLAAEQRVPFADVGGAAIWTAEPFDAAGRHAPSAGVDVRFGSGASNEVLHPAVVVPTSNLGISAGGQQQFVGAYAQDEWAPAAGVEVLATLRYDAWRNFAGERTITRPGGVTVGATFPERWEHQLSPRAGVLFRPSEWIALRASGGGGFRAPTLNELYRPFQVGTIRTLANEALTAERLWGGEAGVELSASTALVARATGFWNRLENPVTNVTVEEGRSPLRQRQNLGAARVRGVELAADARLWRRWTALFAYTLVDARVVEAPGYEQLVGLRLPQDPEHRGFASLTFDDPAILTATVQVRAVGPQFEDDLNTLEMGGYAVVDASVSRRIAWGLEVFAAAENVFDRRYLVGRAGIDTYGQPFTLRAGVRLRAWRSAR